MPIFRLLHLKSLNPYGYSAAGFFHLQKLEVFFSFERCSTAMPCAGRTWMQQGMLVFTEAFMSFQLPVLRTYAFQKAFFSYNNVINGH